MVKYYKYQFDDVFIKEGMFSIYFSLWGVGFCIPPDNNILFFEETNQKCQECLIRVICYKVNNLKQLKYRFIHEFYEYLLLEKTPLSLDLIKYIVIPLLDEDPFDKSFVK